MIGMIKDIETYAKCRDEFKEKIKTLVGVIDSQLLGKELDVGAMISKLQNLFDNISKLDDLQQKFARIKAEDASLFEEIDEYNAKADLLFKELHAELCKIRLSGRFALFYLMRQLIAHKQI
ncbi:hypothetical protein [Thiorhodococcus fuscus]|uniref:Uncharacterized protein n=1 Tax=Thiorhodococcus fuscus TaxID=527200 RepID=A0ABW4Y8V3_9GAMM